MGSTTVFVVQSFSVTFEFTPTGGETMSETAARSKSNPHGDLVTCNFDVTQSFPDGTFHFFGTVGSANPFGQKEPRACACTDETDTVLIAVSSCSMVCGNAGLRYRDARGRTTGELRQKLAPQGDADDWS